MADFGEWESQWQQQAGVSMVSLNWQVTCNVTRFIFTQYLYCCMETSAYRWFGCVSAHKVLHTGLSPSTQTLAHTQSKRAIEPHDANAFAH